MQNFQVFENTEKIGVLQPDEWVVINSYDFKSKTYLRIGLNCKTELRILGIVDLELIEQGIKNGTVILKGIRKIKKKNVR